MADEDFTQKGDTFIFGNDEVRVEEGPRRVTAKATEELLHNDRTAKHYVAGEIDHTLITAKGPITVKAPARDANGEVIELGKPITYIDYGGDAHPGSREFLIFAKRPIDPTKEFFDDKTRNPHYVPEHVRKGALLADDGTPPNRPAYEYIFEVVDTVPIPEGGDADAYEAAQLAAFDRAREVLAETKE